MARKFAADWVQKVDEDAVMRIQPSDHVEQGSCMLEGSEENVDARVGPQLEILHEALLQEVLTERDDADAVDEAAETEPADVDPQPMPETIDESENSPSGDEEASQ
ncbi:MAG: hypothetical protein VX733_05620 [Candidatus Latescibacterota bacterium]|nr:hypothetical protein [Candidatus Latescibacterota bacterium]